jgi:hypothetical protein
MNPTIKLLLNHNPEDDTYDLFVNNNEQYYTIVVISGFNKIGEEEDISIFTDAEWDNLIEISEEFDKHRSWLSNDPPSKNTPREYRDGVNYFYRKGIFKGSLSELEFYQGKNSQEVWDKIYKNSETNITINDFRKWISENYEIIKKYYNYVKNGEFCK